MNTSGTSNGEIVNSASRFFAMLLVGMGCFMLILHGGFAWHWPVFTEIPDYSNTFINNIHLVA